MGPSLAETAARLLGWAKITAMGLPLAWEPMGESAAIVRLPSVGAAVQTSRWLRSLGLVGVTDIVSAFETVAVYFDSFPLLARWWEVLPDEAPQLEGADSPDEASHTIPVCYESGDDTDDVCRQLGISAEQLVEAHTSAEFTVAAIGFCPGFAYLVGLPEELCGLDRRPRPRPRVEPGSVAITGSMSAVYPLVRPGGWWLIGRTPLLLVDEEAGYFPLKAGDRVKFQVIGSDDASRLEGSRL